MTSERLREIAANCEDVSFIASEDNAKELRLLADELDQRVTLGDIKLQVAARCAKIALDVAQGLPVVAPSALVCLKVAAAISREYGVILD